jgi:hypothetical protein
MVWRTMDRFSYLIDRQHRLLLIGIVLWVAVAAFTLSGETFTFERPVHIVSRVEAPKRFWWSVVMWFLTGLFFIGSYLYQNSN